MPLSIMEKRKIEVLLRYIRFRQSFDKSYKLRRAYSKILGKLINKSIFIRRILFSNPSITPTDILFLHPYKLGVMRTEALWRSLGNRGFKIYHEVILPSKILKKRMLCNHIRNIPEEFIFEFAYAKYIVKKYEPKILCSFMDSAVLSSFLRHELKGYGKYINIAHSISGSTEAFTMFDFDYYFVFGKSSIKNIMNNPVRVGNTKAVLAGSPFITSHFVLNPNYEKKNILFFSYYLPAAIKDILLGNLKIVLEWAKIHPEYNLYIKLHPLENPSTIRRLSKGINIKVLEKNVSMDDALKDVSLVLLSWSSAAVEAALLNRPIVVVNDSDIPDTFLYLEKFFQPRAKSVKELHEAITKTFNDYEKYLSQCKKFVDYHLEHKTDSIPFITDCIESIFYGKKNIKFVAIEENLSGLKYSI